MTTQPKKYIVAGGMWDVDLQFNTALANKVGDGCIEFLGGTAPGVDTEIDYEEFIPVEAEAPHSIFGWVQGNNAATDVTIGIYWYDDDQVFDSLTNVFTGVVPSANVWHHLGGIIDAPAAARYAKPFFLKNEDAHVAYLDDLKFTAMPIAFQAFQGTGPQAIANNVLTKIQFPDENFDYGSSYDKIVNYRFTAKAAGIYLADVAVKFDDAAGFAGGNLVTVYLYKNGVANRIIDKDYTTAGGRNMAMLNSVPILLAIGDFLEVWAIHQDGAGVTTTLSADTSFAVYRVE